MGCICQKQSQPHAVISCCFALAGSVKFWYWIRGKHFVVPASWRSWHLFIFTDLHHYISNMPPLVSWCLFYYCQIKLTGYNLACRTHCGWLYFSIKPALPCPPKPILCAFSYYLPWLADIIITSVKIVIIVTISIKMNILSLLVLGQRHDASVFQSNSTDIEIISHLSLQVHKTSESMSQLILWFFKPKVVAINEFRSEWCSVTFLMSFVWWIWFLLLC